MWFRSSTTTNKLMMYVIMPLRIIRKCNAQPTIWPNCSMYNNSDTNSVAVKLGRKNPIRKKKCIPKIVTTTIVRVRDKVKSVSLIINGC